MSETILKVEGLYKKFTKSLKRSMMYGTVDMMRGMMGMHVSEELRKGEFWALQDINFELKRGETLGLIGQNGCGKSTLLRLINGIFPPEKGKITINGRIGALIAVGAGFHPQMSGRENIYLNGTILGMTKKELDHKLDEIIDFAEIGDFIDAPVATYSSGMTVRLGFAIAINAHIDILLVDEILAVGDSSFQLKCFNKLSEMKDKCGLLFVSHDMNSVTNLCNKSILLKNGNQIIYDLTYKSIQKYNELLFYQKLNKNDFIIKTITGIDDFSINSVNFEPHVQNGRVNVLPHENFRILIDYDAKKCFHDVEFNFILSIPINLGQPFFQSTNKTYKKQIDISKGHGTITVEFDSVSLNNLEAKLNFSIWANSKRKLLFWWENIPIFYQSKNSLSTGWNYFNVNFEINEN